jgi:indole-3-glycerol phosphate synthase
MAELVEDRSVLVSESGIESYRDVEKLAEVGVRAILVGETLMRAANIGAKIRQMLGG